MNVRCLAQLTIQALSEGPESVKYKSLLVSAWGILSANETLLSLAINADEDTVLIASVLVNSRPTQG